MERCSSCSLSWVTRPIGTALTTSPASRGRATSKKPISCRLSSDWVRGFFRSCHCRTGFRLARLRRVNGLCGRLAGRGCSFCAHVQQYLRFQVLWQKTVCAGEVDANFILAHGKSLRKLHSFGLL